MRKTDSLVDPRLAPATGLRGRIAPSAAGVRDWVASGAALAAARGGAKTAARFARRNPVLTIATVVVGAGVLAYGVYRRRQARAPLDGEARAVEAETTPAPEGLPPTPAARGDAATPPRRRARPRPDAQG